MLNLIPRDESENFAVGEPLNGAPFCFYFPDCREVGLDYSGAREDALIQFPRGWHVKAGFGTRESGRYHQAHGAYNLRGEHYPAFQPDRVRVVSRIAHNGQTQNCLRLVCGLPDRPGTAIVTHPTVAHPTASEILWSDGLTARVSVWCLVSSESNAHARNNIEPRGRLSFTPQAETTDPLSVILSDNGIKIAWWSEIGERLPISAKRHAALPFPLTRDTWTHLVILMRPLEHENEWFARVRVNDKTIWETPAAAPVRGLISVNMLMAGDEIEKDTSGGTWYYSELALGVRGAGEGDDE